MTNSTHFSLGLLNLFLSIVSFLIHTRITFKGKKYNVMHVLEEMISYLIQSHKDQAKCLCVQKQIEQFLDI